MNYWHFIYLFVSFHKTHAQMMMTWYMASYDEIMDEPCLLFAKEYLLFHTWMSWKSYDSEIRIDHAEFVVDDYWHNVTSWYILKILVIIDHMDDCLTHIVYWRNCSYMIIPLGKNMLMLKRVWRLGGWCAYDTTVGWHLKAQLHCPIFVLSYIPGKHLNILD